MTTASKQTVRGQEEAKPCADSEGNRGSGPPPPSLKNHKNIRLLSNTGPDPLNNHKATKPAFSSPRNAIIDTPAKHYSRLLKCLRSLYVKQCEDQTAPIVCSGSTLFAFILNSSVMLGNYLQQTTFSDVFFFLAP